MQRLSKSLPKVPAFFRRCCASAASGESYGEPCGFDSPGRELSRHLDSYAPDGFDSDRWEAEVQKLANWIRERNRKAILRWFDQRFPDCMKLIPRSERLRFLRGVYDSLEERFGIFERYRGMPRDFEICLAEVEEANSQGSARPSFVTAAKTLARQIYHEYPQGLAYDEWEVELNQLQTMVEAGNGRGIMRWFDHYYPDCMDNVPRDNRAAFVKGLRLELADLFNIT